MKHRMGNGILILLLAVLVLSGCFAGERGQRQDFSPAVEPEEEAGGAQLPGRELTYWAELNGNAGSVRPTFMDVPFFQEWQKRTGVRLKFIQPPANRAKEALNVLLASGEVPDMIEYEWERFPGGPQKAINDGFIRKLNDVIDRYAPNLKRYLQEHPEVDKQVKTAEGSYYLFPFIRESDQLRTFQGPIIRRDWLDDLGLGVPETIEEWYTVLKAFKEKKGAEAPLSFLGVPNALQAMENGAFSGAFGVIKGFYLLDGRVKYGPLEPGYKAFIATFRQWYKEGLIDRNIAAVDTRSLDASILSGRSGATIWNAGAGIGTWQPLLTAADPEARLAGAPYPVLRKGERPFYGQRSHYVSSGGVAISAKSDQVVKAVRMLDYGYSPEGHMFFNFGMKGISYTMKGDYPQYTDLILRNPDKLAPSQALAMYSRASYFGPFVQDERYAEQYYSLPQQREAVKLWADTDVDAHLLPPTPKTELENAELSVIMQDVSLLVDEMSLKLILGIEPMEAYDSYLDKIRSMRIDRALEIQETALARYNSQP